MAGIGAGWYTFLEQGRPINVSGEVLHRIASSLQLNGEETAYVFGLANKVMPAEPIEKVTFDIPPAIRAIITDCSGPAVAVNHRFDMLHWNALADSVYGLDTQPHKLSNNYIWRLYFEPTYRTLFRDWKGNAASITAVFRSMSASAFRGTETSFDELIAALAQSEEFWRAWTSEYRVGRPPAVVLELNLDPVGPFDLHSVRFTVPSLPGIVVFLQAPVDDRARKALQRLAMARSSSS